MHLSIEKLKATLLLSEEKSYIYIGHVNLFFKGNKLTGKRWLSTLREYVMLRYFVEFCLLFDLKNNLLLRYKQNIR